MSVWQVVDSFGEYEDYYESTRASFTCPIQAGLCLGRHRKRMGALAGEGAYWDYNMTFLRRIDVVEAKREESGCLRFL